MDDQPRPRSPERHRSHLLPTQPQGDEQRAARGAQTTRTGVVTQSPAGQFPPVQHWPALLALLDQRLADDPLLLGHNRWRRRSAVATDFYLRLRRGQCLAIETDAIVCFRPPRRHAAAIAGLLHPAPQRLTRPRLSDPPFRQLGAATAAWMTSLVAGVVGAVTGILYFDIPLVVLLVAYLIPSKAIFSRRGRRPHRQRTSGPVVPSKEHRVLITALVSCRPGHGAALRAQVAAAAATTGLATAGRVRNPVTIAKYRERGYLERTRGAASWFWTE